MKTDATTRQHVSTERRAEIESAAWSAIGKYAGKQANRDALPDGSNYSADLSVSGNIDGVEFAADVFGHLTVGYETTKASSATPQPARLIAAILSKLNSATREKVLRELPADFAARGELPDVSADIESAATAMLKQLRAAKQQTVRGSVSFAVRPHDNA